MRFVVRNFYRDLETGLLYGSRITGLVDRTEMTRCGLKMASLAVPWHELQGRQPRNTRNTRKNAKPKSDRIKGALFFRVILSVSCLGLAHLKSLTTLRYLYLKGTRVTDTGLKHLKTLKNLETINLI